MIVSPHPSLARPPRPPPHPPHTQCAYAGCVVRKHVERSAADPRLVDTTYEATHTHEAPPPRGAAQLAAARAAVPPPPLADAAVATGGT